MVITTRWEGSSGPFFTPDNRTDRSGPGLICRGDAVSDEDLTFKDDRDERRVAACFRMRNLFQRCEGNYPTCGEVMRIGWRFKK